MNLFIETPLVEIKQQQKLNLQSMLSQIRGLETTYYIIKELGSGTFGRVYLVQDLQSQKQHACKIISKQLMHKYAAEEMIRAEITIQEKLAHKNIVRLSESFQDQHYIYIILEYCSRGPIEFPTQPCSEEELFRILHQLMAGLDYLHISQVIHRDIKLENIFVSEDGSIKIGDFGWSIKADQAKPVLCGTTEYMPPEVVRKDNYSYKLDVWSLGIIAYILLHCKFPFKGSTQKELIGQILTKEIELDESINPDIKELLYAMLEKDPYARLTIRELYLSPWIRKMMRRNNIFNKYENEEMKKRIKSMPIKITQVDKIGFVNKSLSTGSSSLTMSQNTNMSSSTNPCSPSFHRTGDQIFTFTKEQLQDNFLNVPLPQRF